MYIKTVTLSNFRSFRQCSTELTPFSSKTNVIVGRNGTGKSNVLDAIQFVLLLSNKFVTLRAEERQALLHDDATSSVISAYVEIVLDNSSGRLNVEGDEVLLRRTIGSKKDEFFINRKRVQKSEVLNLLESAGFSKSNPYFIIQQGKVHALCTMSDHERLVLLKEVAGTTVYDEKRQASITQMEVDEASIEKINEVLAYIEQRLVELEGEKEELTEYQALDRSRRALEYTLYSTELKKAREYLDELEHMRGENVEQLHELHEKARGVHDQIRSVELRMKQSTGELRRARQDIEHYTRTLTNQTTTQTRLSLQINDLSTQCEQDTLDHQQAEKKLQSLTAEIKKTETELSPIVKECEELHAKLTNIRVRKTESEQVIEGIYSMLDRAGMTKSEREDYLNSQISDTKTSMEAKRSLLTETETKIKELEKTTKEISTTLNVTQSTLTNHKNLMTSLNTKLVSLKAIRDEHQSERVNIQREIGVLEENRSDLRESVANCRLAYEKTMPKATRMGLKHLPSVLEKLNLSDRQCFGPVISNIQLKDEAYQTAVEVAGGNALLHVIVNNDDTASRILTYLEKHKLGRITFLPLNILQRNNSNRGIEYPESSDVCSLLERCIECNSNIKPAMMHVFGQKLLAKDWDVASQWAESTELDCVTLDGELLSRKGAVTGGWHDATSLKLSTYFQLQSEEEKLDQIESQYKKLDRNLTGLDNSVTRSVMEVQKCEAKKNSLSHTMETASREITSLTARLEHGKSQLNTCSQSINPLSSEIDTLRNTLHRFEDELANPPDSNTLSESQKDIISEHEAVTSQCAEDISSLESKYAQVGLEKSKIEALLRDNYYKRRNELEEMLADDDEGIGATNRRSSRGEEAVSRKRQLALCLAELDQCESAMDKTEMKLSSAQESENTLRSTLSTMKTELESLKQVDLKNKSAVDDLTQNADKLLNKRSMYQSKREIYMQKIQELGSLPSGNELSQYSGESVTSLMRRLDTTNKKLRKYSHVNKKAYDQYVNFSEQRHGLLERKEELDIAREKLEELIESLDRQKDEAINRTFRGVSAHFQDVFSELVPDSGAHGELIMRTDLDDEDDGDRSDVEIESDPSRKIDVEVSRYKGIGIKVRFSALGENYIMSQLSGGQKALVAMALIFAIQRCDPAPFYIFDELDQALDSTHRTAVASLIQRQANSDSNPTQFLCTTFRPEIVHVANKVYGISHQNKVSSIHQMGKKEGLDFVANLVTEETKQSPNKTEEAIESKSAQLIDVGSDDGIDEDTSDNEGSGEEEGAVEKSPETSPITYSKRNLKRQSVTSKKRGRRSNN